MPSRWPDRLYGIIHCQFARDAWQRRLKTSVKDALVHIIHLASRVLEMFMILRSTNRTYSYLLTCLLTYLHLWLRARERVQYKSLSLVHKMYSVRSSTNVVCWLFPAVSKPQICSRLPSASLSSLDFRCTDRTITSFFRNYLLQFLLASALGCRFTVAL